MRVTSKGQVTIPKEVRDALGIKPGSEVAFEFDGVGVRLVRGSAERSAVEADIRRLRGSGRSDMTTEEILALTRG